MLPKTPGDEKSPIQNLPVEGCSGSTEKSRLGKSHVVLVFEDIWDISLL